MALSLTLRFNKSVAIMLRLNNSTSLKYTVPVRAVWTNALSGQKLLCLGNKAGELEVTSEELSAELSCLIDRRDERFGSPHLI